MSTSEIFDADTVKGTIEGIGSEFQSLSSLIQSINSTVTTALGSPDNAMYGDAGNKVLATWDENCSTLNEFIKIYDSWSSMAVAIGNEYGNLQEGTAVVQDADKEAFQTIANANKSSWLKTEDAKTAYKGSTSTYIDASGVEHTETRNLTDGLVHSYKDENGNDVIEYSTLAGGLIGSSINGKLTKNGKEVDKLLTDEEEQNQSKVEDAKKALKTSYEKQYADMQQKQKERKELLNARTQASEFAELGRAAYEEYGEFTDDCARAKWIKKVGELVKRSNKSGIKNSLIIAQIINESGWMNPRSDRAKVLLDMNNVLGINYDLNFDISTQHSTWSKNPTGAEVHVVQGSDAHDSVEKMRSYTSLEQGIEDYADMVATRHPELVGSNNLEDYRDYLNHYTPYCSYPGGITNKYKEQFIEAYNLEQYDT